MHNLTAANLALFVSVFIACTVEAVEAVTIVLAAGTARDWKSAGRGVVAGLAVLAVIIGSFGPAISHLPISILRVGIGGLLLVFGLQWLRKAIMRASGYKALHDEDKIFKEELAAARLAGHTSKFGVDDWYAFTLSFKGVLLEGLEVAFIVLTFGSIQHEIGLASVAAGLAVAITVIAGFALAKPLSKVPENTMKFSVGILLTSFGIFWGAEGSRGSNAKWPGDNWAVFGLIAFVTVASFVLIAIMKRSKAREVRSEIHEQIIDRSDVDQEIILEKISGSFVQFVKSFGAFWYDFIIGDDWRIAAGIVISFVLTHAISSSLAFGWYIIPFATVSLISYSLARVVRES
jgi:uncharacterized membrane protein